MKKKIVAAFACVAVLAGVLAVGGSYSWLVSKNNADDLTVTAASIAVELEEEDGGDFGIPGEPIAISGNYTLTNKGSRECVFRITYDLTVHSGGDKLITDLVFWDESANSEDLTLRKVSDPDTSKVTFYGRLDDEEELDLGQLCATFAVVGDMPKGKNAATKQNAPFTVSEPEVLACQATPEAVQDVFELDPGTDRDIFDFLSLSTNG